MAIIQLYWFLPLINASFNYYKKLHNVDNLLVFSEYEREKKLILNLKISVPKVYTHAEKNEFRYNAVYTVIASLASSPRSIFPVYIYILSTWI